MMKSKTWSTMLFAGAVTLSVACERDGGAAAGAVDGAGGMGEEQGDGGPDSSSGGGQGEGGAVGGAGGSAGEVVPGGSGGALPVVCDGPNPPAECQPACADQADAQACLAAACYWWNQDHACHGEPSANVCDQPDAATCEAAGCEWTGRGCLAPPPATCAELAEPACNARQGCRWAAARCEDDPAFLPCERLNLDQCAVRNDCAFMGMACVTRPEGPCESLDELACGVRADCASRFMPEPECECPQPPPCPPDDPNCGGGGGGCGCVEIFVGCGPRVADCSATPPEVCDQTPGCHSEWIQTPCRPCDCAPDDPSCGCPECPPPEHICAWNRPVDDCAGRPLDRCAIDGRCVLTDAAICPEPPAGAPPFPCDVEQQCVPAGRAMCGGLPSDLCVQTPGCHVEQQEVCVCEGGGMVPEGGDVPAPGGCACEVIDACVANPQGDCEAIVDQFECVNAGCGLEIRWEDEVCAAECGGAPVPLPAGGQLPCDPTDPNCEAAIRPQPLCPNECLRCFGFDPPPPPPPPPPGPDQCQNIPPVDCEAVGCVLLAGPDCVACEPNGMECFPCDPIPVFCVSPDMYCGTLDPVACALDARCLAMIGCAPLDCPPDQPCPAICEELPVCVGAGGGGGEPGGVMAALPVE